MLLAAALPLLPQRVIPADPAAEGAVTDLTGTLSAADEARLRHACASTKHRKAPRSRC
jgi:uncharacterized membrane protein YgcG